MSVTFLDIVRRENVGNMEIRREYAQEIRETDPERAAFIDLQLAARNLARKNRAAVNECKEAAERILKEQKEKDGFLPWEPKAVRGLKPEFYGGFIEHITVSAPYFLEHAEKIYAQAPIRSLTLTKVHSVAEKLFSLPLLEGIVYLCCDIPDDEDASEHKLTDEGFSHLVRSLYMTQLAYLDVRWNNLTDKSLEVLARSPNFPGLRLVEIHGNQTSGDVFDSVGYDGISGLPVWEGYRLEELGLKVKRISEEAGTDVKWYNPIKRLGDCHLSLHTL